MARKLFALEEMETEAVGGAVNTLPEEGEVANAELEVQEEATEVETQAEAIDEGVEAAGQLEEVQEVVEQAIEEGEGLNEPAAEAIRIAVEAIAARIGYNPKKIAGLRAVYASESFASPSSRLANTKIALEGIGEFLSNLWERIKKALVKLIEKAQIFWDKYVSGLRKTKKALESLKDKVSKSSGKIKGEVYFEEAPAVLVSTFAGNGDIGKDVINEYISAHKEVLKANNELKVTNEVQDIISKLNNRKAINDFFTSDKNFVIPAKDKYLVTGKQFSYTISKNDDGTIEIEQEENTIENAESKLGVTVATKQELADLLKVTIEVIDAAIKSEEKLDKVKEMISKSQVDVQKFKKEEIEQAQNAEDKRMVNNAYKSIFKYINFLVSSRMKTEVYHIKLARGVMAYVKFCLSQYKAA